MNMPINPQTVPNPFTLAPVLKYTVIISEATTISARNKFNGSMASDLFLTATAQANTK